ncbi:IS6 family transposase [Deinococcus rubellus]|uniref:IS6 family transposase n=1 Tax=Deinococcus rubellus TaxID=1889240 RepID=UPI003CD07AFF
MSDSKPYRHRFPMTIIQHAVWLYRRFPLSYCNVQELLHQFGIEVSHETLCEWCIKFGPLFAADLRQWRQTVLWRTVDEYSFALDVLLQRHRDSEAAKAFLTRLMGEFHVPEVIHTNQLRSYGAVIREIPSRVNIDHRQQVFSPARCNNLIEQSHRPARRQERQQVGFKQRKRAQAFLSLHARIENLHHHTRTRVSAAVRRSGQAFSWGGVAPYGCPLMTTVRSVQEAISNKRSRGGQASQQGVV